MGSEKGMSAPARLRALLRGGGVHPLPCCHDALSAKMIGQAGFDAAFISGFTTSAAKIAQPDCGLITYTEMIDAARSMVEATTIPLVVDGDNGYGNAMNVKRTIKGYSMAGLAGILLEDQKVPKSCGHVQNKEVVGRAEAVARVQAAVQARDAATSNDDDRIVLIARTDAKQAVSFAEALWRVEAFCDVGADMVFVDALESEEEMREVCALAAKHGRPVLANMLESGKGPILGLDELKDVGFALAVYPLALLGVCMAAMRSALEGLKQGKVPEVSRDRASSVFAVAARVACVHRAHMCLRASSCAGQRQRESKRAEKKKNKEKGSDLTCVRVLPFHSSGRLRLQVHQGRAWIRPLLRGTRKNRGRRPSVRSEGGMMRGLG